MMTISIRNDMSKQSGKTYPIAILYQHLIVTTDSCKEENDLDVVEDVDPLLSLRTLTSDVEHLVCELT